MMASCGVHVESRSIPGVHVEFRHFSFGGSPANFLSRIHQESTWSPVAPSGQHGLHLRTQATELTSQTPCFTYHCHADTMQGQCFFFFFSIPRFFVFSGQLDNCMYILKKIND